MTTTNLGKQLGPELPLVAIFHQIGKFERLVGDLKFGMVNVWPFSAYVFAESCMLCSVSS